MGLATRVIPTILCKGRVAYKGERFNAWRSIGLAAEKVLVHAARGVDEVVLLDVAATLEGRGPDLALVELLAQELFVPFAVGGGVRTVQDVRNLLRAGADKVVIGSAAWSPEYDLLREAVAVVGTQALVVSIDIRNGHAFFRNGITPASILRPEDICVWMQHRGAGEILLQSIDREGTMEGYDLGLIRSVSQAVNIPVIAHGGCSGYADMLAAVKAGAHAVAAGALFQFTDATPLGASKYLAAHGIEARI